MDFLFRDFKKHAFLCCVFCVLVAIVSVVIVYVSNEDPVHSWDYLVYYLYFKALGQSLIKTGNFFDILSASVRVLHYNFSTFVPLMPSYLLFGDSRMSYIVSLFCVYVVPICFLVFTWVMRREDLGRFSLRVQAVFIFTCFTLVFLYTPFWTSSLRGFPDIAGLIPLFIAFVLILRTDLRKINIKNMLIIGSLLYLSFLFRRWFLIAACSFFVASFVESILRLGSEWKLDLRNIVVNLIVGGVVFAFLAVIFQHELLLDIMRKDYRYMYEGYKVSYVQDINRLTSFIPFIYILFSFCSVAYCFAKRECSREIIFIPVFIVTNFFLMNSINGFGEHHALPISLFVLAISMIFIEKIYTSLPRIAVLVSMFVIIFVILNFAHTFFRVNPHLSLYKLAQSHRVLPFKHPNYKEFMRLERDLVQLLEGNSFGVAIFSSNLALNSQIFMGRDSSRKLNHIPVNDVDKRDGMPLKALSARFAVVAMPVQYHLPPDEQFIVSVPATKIFKSEGIGRAYKIILGPYDFGGGVRVFIYEKMRKFTADEVKDFISSFPKDHVKWNNAVTQWDLMLLAGDTVLGDVWGRFDKIGKDTYVAHPGDSTPTSVTFGRVNTNSIEIEATVPSFAATEPCGNPGGDVNVHFIVGEFTAVKNITAGNSIKHIIPSGDDPFTIIFDNNGDSGCDTLTVKFNTSNE